LFPLQIESQRPRLFLPVRRQTKKFTVQRLHDFVPTLEIPKTPGPCPVLRGGEIFRWATISQTDPCKDNSPKIASHPQMPNPSGSPRVK
jgi:hypothetical protein